MLKWQPQLFKDEAPSGTPVKAALEIAQLIRDVNPNLPPLFSLGHLAHSADVPYKFLRAVAERNTTVIPYKVFFISKRGEGNSGDIRWIAAPHPFLLKAQQWINKNILYHLEVHDCAFAYVHDRCAYRAATVHKKSAWVIKVDIKNFFESILETSIYKIFRAAGYQPLLSFEMSRLCTRITTRERDAIDNLGRPLTRNKGLGYVINAYASRALGHLPQGGATSPGLANLVGKSLDEAIYKIAEAYGLRYTRYSDDIILSSRDKSFGKDKCFDIVGQLYRIILRNGFQPKVPKTKVTGPGGRRIVLGFLVDGDTPRLTKEFKDKLRMHLYFCRKESPSAHAGQRGFDSVIGLKHHLLGLISYASRADPIFAQQCRDELNSCIWPVLSPMDLSSIDEFHEIF